LLRYKSIYGQKEIGCPPWLATPRAKTEIAKVMRSLEPLVAWLNTHVGRD
jgi:hypothetical protein